MNPKRYFRKELNTEWVVDNALERFDLSKAMMFAVEDNMQWLFEEAECHGFVEFYDYDRRTNTSTEKPLSLRVYFTDLTDCWITFDIEDELMKCAVNETAEDVETLAKKLESLAKQIREKNSEFLRNQ